MFNASKIRLHRNRASVSSVIKMDFLWDIIEKNILERLEDMRRVFKNIAIIGSATDRFRQKIEILYPDSFIIETHNAEKMLQRRKNAFPCVIDEEEYFPFGPESFDLVIHMLRMHCVTDLPGLLMQIKYALKKEAMVLFTFFGEDSLHELRDTLLHTDMALYEGTGPRIIPFIEVKQMGALMQKIGFQDTVTDRETYHLTYSHILHLCHDIRAMGETNPLTDSMQKPFTRTYIEHANRYYFAHYAKAEERIEATCSFVTATGLFYAL